MVSDVKKVRAEFKKAFYAKDIKKIEQIGKRTNIKDMIPNDHIVKYLNKAINSDRQLYDVMINGICEKYDFTDMYFIVIDINSIKLIKELLTRKISVNACCVLFCHAVDSGRLSIAELIYPYTMKRHNKENDKMESQLTLKENDE